MTPSDHVDGDQGELLEELPRVEALARWYELRDRFGGADTLCLALTEARRHRRLHGHDLRQGCCADVSVLDVDAA